MADTVRLLLRSGHTDWLTNPVIILFIIFDHAVFFIFYQSENLIRIIYV